MNFSTTRFKTLVLREWLQHRWIWLIMVGLIPALVLVSLPFGEVKFPKELPLHIVAGMPLLIGAITCATIAWVTVLFKAPGLGRRDVQDRSIEFWLSLPSTHTESLGATYVAHALLFPLGALVLGLGAGALISPLLVAKWAGLDALGQVAWGQALAPAVSGFLPAVTALFFETLWLAPVVLLLMAASAWLKRLALPLLAVVATFLANYPATEKTFRGAWNSFIEHALTPTQNLARVMLNSINARHMDDGELTPMTQAEFYQSVFTGLATPEFVAGTAVALLCGYAWIVKRRQAG
ncbi:hypothetical protein [Inhella gelatinilytica]|uniref:Uncharacterized protein n=1 Tax=Inhella gelatinilytica TaxID=2795030 RepID=A0A931IVE5_9BURK|nr:hypothetical protein [Inhella gelatinilytica]MBH9551699.1 hypothetical protein [Inhella gelatinilytica]